MARGDRGGYRSARITSAATTAVKATVGVLRFLVIEVATTGTVTINDSTGTKMILPAAWAAGQLRLDLAMAGKIEIITSAADRVVAVYD
jgi:hypothetical protein